MTTKEEEDRPAGDGTGPNTTPIVDIPKPNRWDRQPDTSGYGQRREIGWW